MEITLYFNEAKVLFGAGEKIDEKVANLASFIEDLKTRKGVLHMENFSEDNTSIIFDGDDGYGKRQEMHKKIKFAID